MLIFLFLGIIFLNVVSDGFIRSLDFVLSGVLNVIFKFVIYGYILFRIIRSWIIDKYVKRLKEINKELKENNLSVNKVKDLIKEFDLVCKKINKKLNLKENDFKHKSN